MISYFPLFQTSCLSFFFYNTLRLSFLSFLLFSILNSFRVSARCHFSPLFTPSICFFFHPIGNISTSKILQNWLQGRFFLYSLYCRLLNLKNRIYQRKEECVSVLLFAVISSDIFFALLLASWQDNCKTTGVICLHLLTLLTYENTLIPFLSSIGLNQCGWWL